MKEPLARAIAPAHSKCGAASLFQLKDEPEGSEGLAKRGVSFRFAIQAMLARVSDGLPTERADPPLARIGKGPIRHARGPDGLWEKRIQALSRSFSKSFALACCMRRAASVSLSAAPMRFSALMLSPWRKY